MNSKGNKFTKNKLNKCQFKSITFFQNILKKNDSIAKRKSRKYGEQ